MEQAPHEVSGIDTAKRSHGWVCSLPISSLHFLVLLQIVLFTVNLQALSCLSNPEKAKSLKRVLAQCCGVGAAVGVTK